MSTVKKVLIELFSSKKFLVFLASALVWLAGKVGWGLTEDQLMPILLLASSFIVGQGIADFGKSAAMVNAETIKKVAPQNPPVA